MDRNNCQRNALVCGVLVLGTIALYYPMLWSDFVNYDDGLYARNNFHIMHGFNRASLLWCFQAGYAGNWHPLTWMSHILDYSMYGLKAGGHHLTNVILHALNAAALFLVLRRMTQACWRSAMVAALFAWHPMHVESVAWIAERKDVLSTFFWLLALWAYVRYVEDVKTRVPRFKWSYALSLVFFALALMAKPMVVTLPFLMLLLDWWPLRRFPNAGPIGRAFRTLLVEKIPFLVMSAAGCVLTLIAQDRSGSVVSLQKIPFDQRICNALAGYAHYIDRLFVPVNMTPIYPMGAVPPLSRVISAALLIVVCTGVALVLRNKRPYAIVGWLWFLGTLVPVIGLVQVGLQSTADRYTYTPYLGLFIIGCWGLHDWVMNWRHGRAILVVAALLTAAACAGVTAKQVRYWQNSETLFTHAIEAAPDNYVAHTMLGAYFGESGQYDKARRECEEALRIRPNDGMAQLHLGMALLSEGRYKDSIQVLERRPKVNGFDTRGADCLGLAYLAENMPAKAAEQFRYELEVDAANPWAHFGLGRAFVAEGRLDDGRQELEKALRQNNNYREAHYELAGVLERQHLFEEAISHYRAALLLSPDYVEALNNLAWLLASNPRAELRNGAEAVRLASRACELSQYKAPLLIGTLAAAYAEAGRFDEAVAMAQKAHDVAEAAGRPRVAARNLEMLALYRSHHAYHEAETK